MLHLFAERYQDKDLMLTYGKKDCAYKQVPLPGSVWQGTVAEKVTILSIMDSSTFFRGCSTETCERRKLENRLCSKCKSEIDEPAQACKIVFKCLTKDGKKYFSATANTMQKLLGMESTFPKVYDPKYGKDQMSADHLPTPCYDAKLCDDREVYEPAEDTFLLLDLLQQERDSLMQLSPIICLEIGSGSGVVSTFLYQLLKPKEPLILAVDINPNAAEVTQSTARLNHAPLVSPVLDDAGRALTHRLAGQTDVMLCNPPYVPTDSSETEGSGLHRAWAGGPTGTQLTHRVIRAAHSFLRPNGVLYLLAVKENDIEDLLLRGRSLGLEASVAIQRRCRNEHLYVLKYRKL